MVKKIDERTGCIIWAAMLGMLIFSATYVLKLNAPITLKGALLIPVCFIAFFAGIKVEEITG